MPAPTLYIAECVAEAALLGTALRPCACILVLHFSTGVVDRVSSVLAQPIAQNTMRPMTHALACAWVCAATLRYGFYRTADVLVL